MNLAGVASGLGLLVVTPILGVTILVGGPVPDATGAILPCVSAGPVAGLDAVQAANARAIVAVTQSVVAPRDAAAVQPAEVIALMTAYQESKLRDLANPTVPGSVQVPGASGTGSDHDSVGLFQQRSSWGTAAQRMDPAWATTAFLTRLLAVPGWRSMPPGAAAQAVQVSQYPDAYAQWEPSARMWLSAIVGHGASKTALSAACGGSGLTTHGTTRLPSGFTLPLGTSPGAIRAVTFALAQLGKPYIFGAAGPAAFDCSGLTMAAWAAGGVSLPHYTVAQAELGTPVAAPALLLPGDLIFIPGSDGTMKAPGHVGMYIGRGLVIEAPQTGDVVKLVPLASFSPIAAIRHYA